MCTSSVLSLLTCIGSMSAYSIPGGYVHKLCTFSSDFHGICASIFNFRRICAQALGVLTYGEVLGERSTWENDLLRSVLVTREGAFLIILTYREVFGV